MIVGNIIPRNVIINQGTAEVDNNILRDDFFNSHTLKNVIFILLYRKLFLNFVYPFSSNHGAGSFKDCYDHDYDRCLNKSCHNH